MTVDAALDLNKLSVKLHTLDAPPLRDIAAVIQKKLPDNFAEVEVEVVDCPNLTKEPFNLACEGLGGHPVIIDLGGPPFLLPLVNREKCYDLRTVASLVGDEKCFIIGPGAGPWPYAGTNCEGIVNMVISKDSVIVPGTRISKVDDSDKKGHRLEILPASEYRCCLMANIFCSRGEPCKVVKVHCTKRTGELDFITSLRTALEETFPDKVIGMGGVFVVARGNVKQHVMPDFSKEPLDTDEKLNKWLKFFKMSAPLSAVGTFVSRDPGLDLRIQHFHSFGKHEGGHYHYDTTPEEVEYLGIFATGCTLARVDQPEKGSVTFGKD